MAKLIRALEIILTNDSVSKKSQEHLTSQQANTWQVYLFIYFSAGLTLEINIEQLDYVSVLSQEAGIRVFIGGQREMPFPYEQGISVSPGFSTAIELRKVKAKQ